MQIVHIDQLTPYFGEISAEWRKQQELCLSHEKGEASETLTEGTTMRTTTAVNEGTVAETAPVNEDPVDSATITRIM